MVVVFSGDTVENLSILGMVSLRQPILQAMSERVLRTEAAKASFL